MPDTQFDRLAQNAFEAYCATVNNTAANGKPIPSWEALDGTPQQQGWINAAKAVWAQLTGDLSPGLSD